jgi:hypothetical protein
MYLTEDLREYYPRDAMPALAGSQFTAAEYRAGEKWRNVYLLYLKSLEDEGMTDEQCQDAKDDYMRGVAILEGQDLSKPYCKRKRVLHAVNALCVYGEPDELGHQEFTMAAAKVGLADLASKF